MNRKKYNVPHRKRTASLHAAVEALESRCLLTAATTYLSTEVPTYVQNGWGSYEKNQSNGELATNDGHTITLNGTSHARGLGVHADSILRYDLSAANYIRFQAKVGLDDEVGSNGSVVFQVYLDGVKAFDSGLMTGSTLLQAVDLDITGGRTLELRVTDGDDGNGADHADWAGARLVSVDGPTLQPPASADVYLSDLAPAAWSNGWGDFERDQSNADYLTGDGRGLMLNGAAYTKGLGVHADSSIIYSLAGRNSADMRFQSSIGVDDEVNQFGSIVFQVLLDGALAYDSGVMTGLSATKSINLSVAGKGTLELRVTDAGDGITADHGDWASARLFQDTTPIQQPPQPPAPPPPPPPTPPAPPPPPPPSGGQGAYGVIQAEGFDASNGVQRNGGDISSLDNGDWVRFSSVNFDNGLASVAVSAAVPQSNVGGLIEFRADSSTGRLLGTLSLQITGSYGSFVTQKSNLDGAAGFSGTHDLYMVFRNQSSMAAVDSVQFSTTRLIKIMPVGDSITQSHGSVPSFRYYLWNNLQAGGYPVDFVGSWTGSPNKFWNFDQNHDGHSGYTATQIANSITAWAGPLRPDIVLLHAGTNDVMQGYPPEETIRQLGLTVDRLRAINPNVTVLVAQILPLGSWDVTRLNAMIPGFAASKNTAQSRVLVVDQYTGMSVGGDLRDWVHPSDAGEIKMAARWYDALQGVL